MLLRRIVFIGSILGALLVGAQAAALSIDQLNIRSSLGQPFQAQLLIRGVETLNPDISCVKIGDTDNGLPGIGAVGIAIDKVANGWLVRLRGRSALNEPVVQFAVKFNCEGEQYVREYSVLLDPPVDAIEAPQVVTPPAMAPLAQKLPAPKTPKQMQRHKHRSAHAPTSLKHHHRHPKVKQVGSTFAPKQGTQAPTPLKKDVIKLSAVVPPSALRERELELMAKTEDQASRLVQMESKIKDLEKIVEKLKVYVPEASQVVASPVLVAPAAVKAPAPTVTKPVPKLAVSSELALAKEQGFDVSQLLWVALGILSIVLLFSYWLHRRAMYRPALPWLDTEMLQEFEPELREELLARLHAHEPPQPYGERTDLVLKSTSAGHAAADPKVDFVEVENVGNVADAVLWLIANGEGDRALAVLREELRIDPEQPDLWRMAFDYLYSQNKKPEFINWAQRFKRHAAGTDAWGAVCDMGFDLDPGNRLFVNRDI